MQIHDHQHDSQCGPRITVVLRLRPQGFDPALPRVWPARRPAPRTSAPRTVLVPAYEVYPNGPKLSRCTPAFGYDARLRDSSAREQLLPQVLADQGVEAGRDTASYTRNMLRQQCLRETESLNLGPLGAMPGSSCHQTLVFPSSRSSIQTGSPDVSKQVFEVLVND